LLPIETWHWLAFGAFVIVVLTLDLTVFHRHSKESTLREAAGWTVVWCSMALAFNGLLWWWITQEKGPEIGRRVAIEFLTGYLIEWSLSMDNVFVFAVIFSFFKVPLKYQYRVLFWGILGAIVMRLTFILVGSAMIRHFGWVIPVFGLFLIYTGIKLVMHDDEQVDPGNNLLMRMARKLFPVASGEHGNRFFVREGGKLCITRLFLVLLVVESTDVLFAVDSVPAIFGITREPFIVFTSNIFAILGLRALYFLLAGVMDMFRYLKYGLSAVLIFVGIKMVAEYASHLPPVVAFIQDNLWSGFHIEEGHHLIPPPVSLVIVLSLLGISIIASIVAKKREDARGGPPSPHGPSATPEVESPSDAKAESKI
jgi:tellurite resistance protein TerC